MNIKSILTLILTTLFLTACSNTPSSSTEVDRLSLLRSMTYTHRHLVAMDLTPHTDSELRRGLLLRSHCDLIDRGLVHAKKVPELCIRSASGEGVCVAEFHRCIGTCTDYKDECVPCELKAQRCLQQQGVETSSG